MPTVLEAPSAIGRNAKKEVRVRITAHTLINQDGRGVPLYKGSVLDVFEADAALLVSSYKAERVGKDVAIFVAPNPFPTQTPAKKVS